MLTFSKKLPIFDITKSIFLTFHVLGFKLLLNRNLQVSFEHTIVPSLFLKLKLRSQLLPLLLQEIREFYKHNVQEFFLATTKIT
jgi:hypothetical protein